MQNMPQSEQPVYLLEQSKKRAIVPKVIILIVLGIIFYFGILLNIALLEMSASTETLIRISALIILFILITVGIYLSYRRSVQQYKFFREGITFINKKINYVDIKNTTPKQNLLDKLFHTYQIKLGDNFFLRHIPNDIQVENYLQQLVAYAQKQEHGFDIY